MKLTNKNKKIICSVLSFLLVASVFVGYTTKVNALTSRKKLPYYVDYNSSIYFDVDLNDFHNQLVSLGFPDPTNSNYICWLGDFRNYNSTNQTALFDVYYITLSNSDNSVNNYKFYGLYSTNDTSTPLVNRLSPNAFDWQTNYVCFVSSISNTYKGRVTRYTYQWNINTQTISASTQNPNGYYETNKVFLSGKNASNKNTYGFTSSIPIWYRYNDGPLMSGSYRVDYTGGYDIYESFEIYTFGIPVGAPIKPDLSGDNITNPQGTAPTSPTIQNFTPSTYNPPSFDSSSTTNALQSIYDGIIYNGQYLIQNIGGALSTLTENIKNYFEYLKSSIDYGMQKIINNIKNAIQNMYDNIENFFSPVLDEIKETLNDIKNFGQKLSDFVDLFIHPFDSTQASQDIANSSFINQISSTKTQIQTFTSSFSSIAEPNNLIYTFDLTGLFISFGVWEIDLTIFSGILPYIRGIFAVILLYSLIVTIFTSINSYIGGNSSKNENND